MISSAPLVYQYLHRPRRRPRDPQVFSERGMDDGPPCAFMCYAMESLTVEFFMNALMFDGCLRYGACGSMRKAERTRAQLAGLRRAAYR